MRRKIIGVTVGTPTSPQAIIDKTEQAEQIKQNEQDIKSIKKDVDELKRSGDGGSGSNLPSVTKEDDGKVLTVSGGQWTAKELPKYDGEYAVTPSTEGDITLATAQKMLDADVKVNKIPYAEVSNNTGGKTATIG